MKNDKAHFDLMKYKALPIPKEESNFIQDLYIQMIIDEAHFNYNKDLLEKQIDEALDARDKAKFQSLTEQYNMLLRNLS